MIQFFNRDFSPWPGQPRLDWAIEQMAWSALGGPDTARARCPRKNRGRGSQGQAGSAASWVDLLRRPVEISREQGEPDWWGYVASVELRAGECSFRFSLDGMANTVKYTYTGPDGVTQFKSSADANSVELYGVKETFAAIELSNSPRAEAVARSILARGGSVRGPWKARQPWVAPEVRLELRGWWETLGWRYFLYGGQGNVSAPEQWKNSVMAAVGSSATNVKSMQTVQDSNLSYPAWSPVEVELVAQAVGAPADKLRASIYAADGNGLPTGNALDSADLSVTDTTAALPYRVTLNRSASFAPGTPFAVVLSRTGAVSSVNYWRIGLFETVNPPAFSYKTWNGSAWVARSPTLVALVKVYGAAETTALVQFYALAAEGGQFLARTCIQDASGVYSSSLRDQVYTYREEIESLLGAGTSGGRRMLAEVTPARVLVVRAAGEESALDLLIDPQGRALDRSGMPLCSGARAVGRWARFTAWPDAPPVFAARAQWEREDGKIVVSGG